MKWRVLGLEGYAAGYDVGAVVAAGHHGGEERLAVGVGLVAVLQRIFKERVVWNAPCAYHLVGVVLALSVHFGVAVVVEETAHVVEVGVVRHEVGRLVAHALEGLRQSAHAEYRGLLHGMARQDGGVAVERRVDAVVGVHARRPGVGVEASASHQAVEVARQRHAAGREAGLLGGHALHYHKYHVGALGHHHGALRQQAVDRQRQLLAINLLGFLHGHQLHGLVAALAQLLDALHEGEGRVEAYLVEERHVAERRRPHTQRALARQAATHAGEDEEDEQQRQRYRHIQRQELHRRVVALLAAQRAAERSPRGKPPRHRHADEGQQRQHILPFAQYHAHHHVGRVAPGERHHVEARVEVAEIRNVGRAGEEGCRVAHVDEVVRHPVVGAGAYVRKLADEHHQRRQGQYVATRQRVETPSRVEGIAEESLQVYGLRGARQEHPRLDEAEDGEISNA